MKAQLLMTRPRFGVVAGAALLLAACGSRKPVALSGNGMRFLQVEPDGRVRMFPGTPLEEQDFMRGKPEYHWFLLGTHVENGKREVELECRGGKVYRHAEEIARLTATGFVSDTWTYVVASDGSLTMQRRGEPAPTGSFRYEGLRAGDWCTAALLFHMVPVPGMHGS